MCEHGNPVWARTRVNDAKTGLVRDAQGNSDQSFFWLVKTDQEHMIVLTHHFEQVRETDVTQNRDTESSFKFATVGKFTEVVSVLHDGMLKAY